MSTTSSHHDLVHKAFRQCE